MNFNQIKYGRPSIYVDGIGSIDPEAQAVYSRIIADGGVSDLTRLNYFVVGLKTIYGTLANVPVCYDAHWIGYKLGSGTGATAGQAAAKLYSLTVAGDAVQSTAASQPLLLAHNGASSDNYYYGSGVNGNFVSTPNASANQITGDIEIIANFKLDSLSADSAIIAKDNISSRLYNLIYIGSGADSGKIYFGRNIGGTFGYSISSVISGFTTSTIYWLKVNRSSSTGDVKFFTSTDGITYTQLGTTQTTTAGVMTTGTVKVNVGALSNDNANMFQGKIYRATISNSIGGTPVVDFNPATYNASTSQTQWTSSTGEVWTINENNSATGYKGVLVDRTIVQADGIDDKLINITASVSQPNTNYLSFKSIQTSSTTQWMVDGFGSLTRQIINKQNATTIRTFAGSFANSTTTNLDKLMLISAIYNSATSSAYKNNVLIGSGLNVGTQNLGGVVLFGDATSTFAQGIINTFLSTTDNTKLTETYNLIRSLNNNAF